MDLDLLKDQLKRHEGLRLKPYRCTENKLTIGYGRNLEDVGITEDEAETLLNNDIRNALADTKHLFGAKSFKRLNDARQAVLVNMMFNLGYRRLSTFVRLRKAIEREDYSAAAREMIHSRWYNQVGTRAKELTAIMRHGSPL